MLRFPVRLPCDFLPDLRELRSPELPGHELADVLFLVRMLASVLSATSYLSSQMGCTPICPVICFLGFH